MHFSNELRLFISNQGSTKHNAIKCCDQLYLLSKHQCEYKHYISLRNTETRLRKYCMICLIRIVLTCEVTWNYFWSILSNVYIILHWNAGTRPRNISFKISSLSFDFMMGMLAPAHPECPWFSGQECQLPEWHSLWKGWNQTSWGLQCGVKCCWPHKPGQGSTMWCHPWIRELVRSMYRNL